MRVRRTLVWAALLASAGCADPKSPAVMERDDEEPEDTGEPCEVPSEFEALLDYLRSGEYKSFARESKIHNSTGPHGGRVLTYVNDVLFDSLEAGNSEHPRCAASVKELFLGKDEVSGWAVFVKTRDESANGKGFYWLEILSTDPGRSPDYEGQGIGVCTGCHGAGIDYFRAPWPLQ